MGSKSSATVSSCNDLKTSRPRTTKITLDNILKGKITILLKILKKSKPF